MAHVWITSKLASLAICIAGLMSTSHLVASTQATEKRIFKTEDIARVKELGELAISPDGTTLIFQVTELNGDGDQREGALWKMSLKERRASKLFPDQHDDSMPAWSPDGSKLAFLRADEGATQLHVLDLTRGLVCSLTDLENGVNDYRWSPDGQNIAFTSAVAIAQAPVPPPGVRIITRADFRSEEVGGGTASLPQIWVVAVDSHCGTQTPRQLTQASVAATLAFWSVDSRSILFTTNDTMEAYYGAGTSTLRSVALIDGQQSVVRPFKVPGTSTDMEAAPQLYLSPNGSKVAFSMGNPEAPSDFAQDDVFVMDMVTGETTNITVGYDREVGGDGLMWRDDRRLISIKSDAGNANLIELDILTQKVRPLWIGRHVVQSFHLAQESNRLIAVASSFVSPPELYEVADGTGMQISEINRHIRDELLLTAPEEITYEGPGGETIHGYLHQPAMLTASQRYPLIVWAHGGPYSWWSSAFDGDIQAMAAAGYFVLYVNPRGSMSYGQVFAGSLAGEWPGPEYDDTMAGVDYVLAHHEIDAEKIGIAGGSAGAILTDWAITHTNRFGAAVSISSVADNSLYWFLGDQPDMADPDKYPWLDEKDKARSPITHGLDVSTPTLFMSGTRDYRTPSSVGSELMFKLLKHLRVPTALIQFEGAGHVIRGSNDARHRGLSIHYLLRWMDLHLKGRAAPEFQVRPAG